MKPTHWRFLALLWVVATAIAQAPVAPPSPTAPAAAKTIVVQIECVAEGKRVPRFANKDLTPELARAIRFEQRRLVWNIDDERVESPVALATALERAAKSPTSLRDKR